MNNNIQEEYENHIFKVEFITSMPLRRSHRGKHWPKTTQCIIYDGQRIIGLGEVVKHEKDPDNPKYARINSAKKAFNNCGGLWKEIRTKLWKKILIMK